MFSQDYFILHIIYIYFEHDFCYRWTVRYNGKQKKITRKEIKFNKHIYKRAIYLQLIFCVLSGLQMSDRKRIDTLVSGRKKNIELMPVGRAFQLYHTAYINLCMLDFRWNDQSLHCFLSKVILNFCIYIFMYNLNFHCTTHQSMFLFVCLVFFSYWPRNILCV